MSSEQPDAAPQAGSPAEGGRRPADPFARVLGQGRGPRAVAVATDNSASPRETPRHRHAVRVELRDDWGCGLTHWALVW